MIEIKPFVRQSLGLEESHLEMILRRQFIDVASRFAAEAHRYDPTLTDADIYQASRNVMSMNFMQLLLGLPVELTPAVFAYSLLYPYSDNILDNPSILPEDKKTFGVWFLSVLQDEDPAPRNERERRIREMISLVERQYPRKKFPKVYESMLAIHSAQSRSQELLRASFSPYEADVLGLSFEKGGASVLGDGYLVAGELSDWQRRFMFGYGCFTQLMDDVEDIRSDSEAGIATVFSQSAGNWKLDGVTNRLFHFGEGVFSQMERFPGEDAAMLRSLVWTCIQPALIGSLIRSHRYYTHGYLQALQKHFPFHFRTLERQEKKLRRNRFSLVRAGGSCWIPTRSGNGRTALGYFSATNIYIKSYLFGAELEKRSMKWSQNWMNCCKSCECLLEKRSTSVRIMTRVSRASGWGKTKPRKPSRRACSSLPRSRINSTPRIITRC